MESISLTKDEWTRSLRLFQNGINALYTHQYHIAIVFLVSTLEWVTPITWYELWLETRQAIAEAQQKLYLNKQHDE